MEVRYYVDGKKFKTREAAEKYEKKLAEEAEKQKKLAAEKDARLKELDDAFNKYIELCDAFERDYPQTDTHTDLFKLLFM